MKKDWNNYEDDLKYNQDYQKYKTQKTLTQSSRPQQFRWFLRQ